MSGLATTDDRYGTPAADRYDTPVIHRYDTPVTVPVKEIP
ncbi:hypothetical protein GCM10010140_55060 [Streptosporangium pseudovulgare]|uniref:Uncharacterized protein n=1 Tax=Streptosporangium pseudovulgare TaxID=35765 RepID=A0ABQ2RAV3_9ACTN|nr:hypothetical protein GCM10010140_55060 [Streptosporangium pseudovulgare]